jgi:Tfp pilus assembly protein PilX
MTVKTLQKQTGAATLLAAVMLLVGVTLITLLTARVVLVDTKVEANDYRTKQAVAAASAALDYGIGYFMDGGLDHDNDDVVDTIDSGVFSLGDASATLTFNNNDGTCTTASSMSSSLVTAVGFSDDGVATRTITTCVGSIPLFGNPGPEQPLISGSNIMTTGNASIINRYTNVNTWSGGGFDIGNSSAMRTYLNDGSITCLTDGSMTEAEKLRCESNDSAYATQLISTSDLGNGLDIIDADSNLANLNTTLSGTEPTFFSNFFAISFEEMEQLAENINQHIEGGNLSGTLDGYDGIIFIDGDASITGGTIGTRDNPAIVIVNGNFSFSGNPTINGVLFVIGQMDAGGTITVIGSAIVEGDTTVVPAGEDAVEGNGTLNLVYAPGLYGDSDNPIKGTGTVVAGSWRDW